MWNHNGLDNFFENISKRSLWRAACFWINATLEESFEQKSFCCESLKTVCVFMTLLLMLLLPVMDNASKEKLWAEEKNILQWLRSRLMSELLKDCGNAKFSVIFELSCLMWRAFPFRNKAAGYGRIVGSCLFLATSKSTAFAENGRPNACDSSIDFNCSQIASIT